MLIALAIFPIVRLALAGFASRALSSAAPGCWRPCTNKKQPAWWCGSSPVFLAEDPKPDEGRFVWSYTIEIENRTGDPVQLISRFWRITDENGLTQSAAKASLASNRSSPPGERFRYTSAAPLAAPSSVADGAYSMRRNGGAFTTSAYRSSRGLTAPHKRLN